MTDPTGTQPLKIALLGAGLIGRRHAALVAAEPDADLCAVVDPTDAGRQLAAHHGAPWFADLAGLLAARKPDGVIIATPNRVHVENGLEAVAAGIPALVEKPIADSVAEAARLVAAAEAAGVPLLTGHHRRYNPMLAAARDAIRDGRLGQVLAVHAQCWFRKPDAYFDPEWRRQPGAGPVLINLIHDVDNLRFLCGDITSVQATKSSFARGYPVEDTAVALLGFASGAVGTMTVSDAVVAPWSWELTSGENADYPRQNGFCYLIGGSHGSLSLPSLDLYRNDGLRDWYQPILRERLDFAPQDPLTAQLAGFCSTIRGRTPPAVTGREGLRTLAVIDAMTRSALTGARIVIDPEHPERTDHAAL